MTYRQNLWIGFVLPFFYQDVLSCNCGRLLRSEYNFIMFSHSFVSRPPSFECRLYSSWCLFKPCQFSYLNLLLFLLDVLCLYFCLHILYVLLSLLRFPPKKKVDLTRTARFIALTKHVSWMTCTVFMTIHMKTFGPSSGQYSRNLVYGSH